MQIIFMTSFFQTLEEDSVEDFTLRRPRGISKLELEIVSVDGSDLVDGFTVEVTYVYCTRTFSSLNVHFDN